jgi:hypothetical protein
MNRSRWFSGRAKLGAIVLTAGGLVVASSTASAAFITSVSDTFELDGDITDTSGAPPDWASLFDTSTTPPSQADPMPTGFSSAAFFRDFTPGSTADSTTYATGSKDTLPITPGWQCKKSNNVTDKGDIQNTYMTPFRVSDPGGPKDGHLIIYAGLEKNAPNGNNNMAVWLLQDDAAGCTAGNGNTPFTGGHRDGDVLLVAAFLNGGSNPVITAYKWSGSATGGSVVPIPGGVGGKCGTAGSANVCAITNASQITTPWATTDKVLGAGTKLGGDQFYEMGADLTELGQSTCFANYIANTRSSQELGATLYDFAGGSASTCGSTTMKEPAATASPTTIRSGGSVTLTFYEKNNGSVNLTNPHVTTDIVGAPCDNISTPDSSGGTIIGDDGDGKFEPDETWQFSCTTTAITGVGDHTINAFGHGSDPSGSDVHFCPGTPPSSTYPCDPDETTSVTVTVIAPATELTETASAVITYTFKEKNTGTGAPLTNPYVESAKCDSTPAQTTSGGFNVGDTGGGALTNNGVLDPGETWTWTCTHTLAGPTGDGTDSSSSSETSIGTGHGTDATSQDVTYSATPKERDSVTVTIQNNAQCTAKGANPPCD